MAKQKPADTESPTVAATTPTPEEAAEEAATESPLLVAAQALAAKLEAENAELKAKLEAATQPLPSAPPPPPFERYAVSVPGHSHARRVVSAANPGQAVEVYKASMGILALPAGPLVEPTDEPTWDAKE